MQKKQRKPLPKTLPGSVHPQFVRCGRPSCRCADGALHGPYYYRFWWEAGRLCKAYVKRSELEQVRAFCQAGRVQSQRDRERRKQAEGQGRQDWRGLIALLKDIQRYDSE